MPSYIAIGDIHGMAYPLRSLLECLPTEGELVFLGDYIDRGSESKSVIEQLMRLRNKRSCHFIRGNHEAMLLDAQQGDRDAEMHWIVNGGLMTLESYGGRIPSDHLAFLEATIPYLETNEYIFVHAGLLPGQPIAETGPDIYLWVRQPFLTSSYDWGKRIIHGHTPQLKGTPEVRANRINIDTGAVYGETLTALLLPEIEFVSVPTGIRSHGRFDS